MLEQESLIRNLGRPPRSSATSTQQPTTSNSKLLASLHQELAKLKAFKATTIAKGTRTYGGPFAVGSNHDQHVKVSNS
jgi:hypothetical protein